MMKVKKRIGLKIIIVLLSLICVVTLLGLCVLILDAPARAELKNMVIGKVDFNKLKDGVYTGEYRGTKNNARDVAVEVTVEAGVVSKIIVTEGAFAGGKDNNKISDNISISDLFGQVIGSQSLQVDGISGATLTTNAHLKAIENALQKALVD